MISELDIWRSAAVMVKRFGTGAAQEAAARAGRLMELGDASGHAMWLQIARAVDRLAAREADPTVALIAGWREDPALQPTMPFRR